MRLIQMVQAFLAVQAFAALSLPFPKARVLRRLCGRVKEEYEFYCAEEQKLLLQYARKGPDGSLLLTDSGRYQIERKEDIPVYQKKIEELSCLEVDNPPEPLRLTEAEIGEQRISAAFLAAAEPFIVVGEG